MARPPRHRALARRCSNGPGRRCRVRGESAGYRLSEGGAASARRETGPCRPVPSSGRTLVQRDWRDDRIAELEAELAAKNAVLAEQDRRIAELEKRVAQLLEQLGQNSRNSHLPPSSDTPEERRKRKNREKKLRQERKRG